MDFIGSAPTIGYAMKTITTFLQGVLLAAGMLLYVGFAIGKSETAASLRRAAVFSFEPSPWEESGDP